MNVIFASSIMLKKRTEDCRRQTLKLFAVYMYVYENQNLHLVGEKNTTADIDAVVICNEFKVRIVT